MIEFLKNAEKIGLSITKEKEESFKKYKETLLFYNEQFNLTALTEERDVYLKHFFDSITLLDAYNFKENLSLCDVGSGAGFPSLPIKILRNDIKLTMIDSLNKRVDFLNNTVNLLGLKDAKALHLRAEEAGQKPELREKFDVVTARAVAQLKVLLEYTIPLVKVGGVFLCMKGPDPDEEIKEAKNALKILGAKTVEIKKYLVDDAFHSVIVIKKEKPTEKKYPRKPGTAKKLPL